MPVQYPSHLYIRIDRPLREAMKKHAANVGTTVSALARRELAAAFLPPPSRFGVSKEGC